MCGSCRVTVGGKMKFACVDGADFDGHLVNFDELSLRQKRFEREEKAALERFRGESARKLAGHEPARIERRTPGDCALPVAGIARGRTGAARCRACPRTSRPSPPERAPWRSSRPKCAPTISKR